MTRKTALRNLPIFRRTSPAISELIGVILLIAIIAGLMGILSFMLLGQPAPPNLPHFSYTGCVNEDGTIILTHTGGESIRPEAYRVYVLDAGKKILFRTNLSDGPGTWSLGNSISIATGLNASVIDITQIVVSTEKGETLVQWNEIRGLCGKFNGCTRTITASAGPGGTISPSGTFTVPCRAGQSFTITADKDHTFYDLSDNGVSMGAGNPYVLTDITEDHVITAQFIEGCEVFNGYVYNETTKQGVAGIRVEQWSDDQKTLIRSGVTNGDGFFSIPSPIDKNEFFDLKCPNTASWVTTKSYMEKFSKDPWQIGEWREDVQENQGSSKCNPYLDFYGHQV